MMKIILGLLAAGWAVGMAMQAVAHGDSPHRKCKKGYELNDAHKCVKAVKKYNESAVVRRCWNPDTAGICARQKGAPWSEV